MTDAPDVRPGGGAAAMPPPTGAPVAVAAPPIEVWGLAAVPSAVRFTQALPAATVTRLAVAAAVAGVLLELLRPHGPLGIGVLACVVVLLAMLVVLARDVSLDVPVGARWWFALPAVVGAGGLALRASPTLTALNAAMALGALLLLSVRLPARGSLARAGLLQLVVSTAGAVGTGAAASIGVCDAVVRRAVRPKRGRTRRLGELGIGVAAAVPLLAIFAGLFASADAGFDRLLTAALDHDFGGPVETLVWMLTFGVLALVVACSALVSAPPQVVDAPRPRVATATVLWIVLGSLAALFVLFLTLQASYLFGGDAYLERTSGLTAAQYARQGFFQLVAAAALVIPLVLSTRALAREEAAAQRAVQLGGALLLLLTLPLLGSSLHRMWMYQERFGLTELRVYVVAAIAWLGVVVVAAAIRGAARSRRGITLAAVLAAFAITGALDLVNPDALIARVNLDRPRADEAYVGGLSTDALPAVRERMRAGDPAASNARRAYPELERQLRLAERADWRSWNWSRERARG